MGVTFTYDNVKEDADEVSDKSDEDMIHVHVDEKVVDRWALLNSYAIRGYDHVPIDTH